MVNKVYHLDNDYVKNNTEKLPNDKLGLTNVSGCLLYAKRIQILFIFFLSVSLRVNNYDGAYMFHYDKKYFYAFKKQSLDTRRRSVVGPRWLSLMLSPSCIGIAKNGVTHFLHIEGR